MMKHEFESRVGFRIDPDCYERIEYVYMNCDAIEDKDHIARIYKCYDMNGIECIFRTIKGIACIEDMERAVRYLKTTRRAA